MYKVNIKNNDLFLSSNGEYGFWSANFETLELAQNWLNKQLAKPSKVGCFSEIINISAEVELKKSQFEAKKYLADTDWYIIRKVDSGVDVPNDVVLKRQQAREIL